MKVWSQTLQSEPIVAPAITWANAQIRVPAPIASLSTSARSWMNGGSLIAPHSTGSRRRSSAPAAVLRPQSGMYWGASAFGGGRRILQVVFAVLGGGRFRLPGGSDPPAPDPLAPDRAQPPLPHEPDRPDREAPE